MRFYLLSDNIDTLMGMRLAGIEGVVIHEKEEVEKALTEAMNCLLYTSHRFQKWIGAAAFHIAPPQPHRIQNGR